MTANKMVFDARRVGRLFEIETSDRPAPEPSRPEEKIIYLPPSVPTCFSFFYQPTRAPITRSSQNVRLARQMGPAKPGYWGVILPIPGSAWKGMNEEETKQIVNGLPGYQRTPMLVDLFLLSAGLLAGKDLLDGGWVLCPDRYRPKGSVVDFAVEMSVELGRSVFVTAGVGRHNAPYYLSAARWICD